MIFQRRLCPTEPRNKEELYISLECSISFSWLSHKPPRASVKKVLRVASCFSDAFLMLSIRWCDAAGEGLTRTIFLTPSSGILKRLDDSLRQNIRITWLIESLTAKGS